MKDNRIDRVEQWCEGTEGHCRLWGCKYPGKGWYASVFNLQTNLLSHRLDGKDLWGSERNRTMMMLGNNGWTEEENN